MVPEDIQLRVNLLFLCSDPVIATGPQAAPRAPLSRGSIDAGCTSGTFPGQTSAGHPDAFVRKYDHSGAELWTPQFGSTSIDEATGISADGTGVYVAGETDGTLPGQTSAGSADAFVCKYDHSGVELWTRQFGTTSTDFAYGISADPTGVYVVGYTDGILPGQISAGAIDVFVRKYDHSRVEMWTRQFGSASSEFAYGISVDATGVQERNGGHPILLLSRKK
jgi:hypothetical protein